MQWLTVHRGHQAPRRGSFAGSKRPSQVVGDQGERALVRQPVQLTGTAAAAQNRLGRADHQAAAGQDLEQVVNLVRADAQIVDGDNGTDLPEQLAALRLGQLDRPIEDIQPPHQILQEIPDTIPVRSQVDAGGGESAFRCGGHNRIAAASSCRIRRQHKFRQAVPPRSSRARQLPHGPCPASGASAVHRAGGGGADQPRLGGGEPVEGGHPRGRRSRHADCRTGWQSWATATPGCLAPGLMALALVGHGSTCRARGFGC